MSPLGGIGHNVIEFTDVSSIEIYCVRSAERLFSPSARVSFKTGRKATRERTISPRIRLERVEVVGQEDAEGHGVYSGAYSSCM